MSCRSEPQVIEYRPQRLHCRTDSESDVCGHHNTYSVSNGVQRDLVCALTGCDWHLLIVGTIRSRIHCWYLFC